MIYLDYSANTPSDPAVLDVFLKTERLYMGNPNSTHPAGQAAREKMSRVTDRIAALLGLKSSEIIYTTGASEGNCTGFTPHWAAHHLHGVGTFFCGRISVRTPAAGMGDRPCGYWTGGHH